MWKGLPLLACRYIPFQTFFFFPFIGLFFPLSLKKFSLSSFTIYYVLSTTDTSGNKTADTLMGKDIVNELTVDVIENNRQSACLRKVIEERPLRWHLSWVLDDKTEAAMVVWVCQAEKTRALRQEHTWGVRSRKGGWGGARGRQRSER